MELALSLEKLNYNKLKALDKLAVDAEDFNLADYTVTMTLLVDGCPTQQHASPPPDALCFLAVRF